MAPNVSLTLLVPDRSAPTASKRKWWQPAREPGVSRNLAAIRRALQDTPILASGEGLTVCAALTERELVIGRAHWFGARVDRYRLSRLSRLRVITNRDVDILEMEFADLPSTVVAVMYDAAARDDFAALISRLQRGLAPARLARPRSLLRSPHPHLHLV